MIGSTVDEDQPDGSASPTRPARPRATFLRRPHVREAGWAYLFILPQLVGLVVFVLVPFAGVVAMSFTRYDGLTDPVFVGVQNYLDELADPTFAATLGHTALYTAVLVPASVAISLAIALAISRLRNGTIYRWIYFLPGITSPVAVAVVWLYLLNPEFGPINQMLLALVGVAGPDWLGAQHLVVVSIAVVGAWHSLGYNVILLVAGLRAIPTEYLEAARIDGATGWKQVRLVTVPLLSPTLLFVTVVTMITALQVFDLVYVLTQGGPAGRSETLVFRIYALAFDEFTFGRSAAVAVVLLALTLVLTVVALRLQKRWVHYDH